MTVRVLFNIPLQRQRLINEGTDGGGEGGVLVGERDCDRGRQLSGDCLAAVYHCG